MTSFKSLCCIWALLLFLQHVLCFDLNVYCRRRCLHGKGGMACRCNAFHFTGKRSYDPKHGYLGPKLTQTSRHNRLLSILNRPELAKTLTAYSSNDLGGTTRGMRLSESQFDGDDVQDILRGSPGGKVFEAETETEDSGQNSAMDERSSPPSQRPIVLPSNQHKGFARLDNQKWKSAHFRYPALTRELAQLVKYTWKHMPSPMKIKYSQESSPSATVQAEPAGKASLEADGDDLTAVDDYNSRGSGEISDHSQRPSRARVAFVKAVNELLKRLPILLRRYDSIIDTGLDDDGLIEAGNTEGDVRDAANLKGGDADAWYRLMKYLEHNIAFRERRSSLQRTKRDERVDHSYTKKEEKND